MNLLLLSHFYFHSSLFLNSPLLLALYFIFRALFLAFILPFFLFTSPAFTFKYLFRSRLELFPSSFIYNFFILPLTLATKNGNLNARVGDVNGGCFGVRFNPESQGISDHWSLVRSPNHASEVYFFSGENLRESDVLGGGDFIFRQPWVFGMLRRPHTNPPT